MNSENRRATQAKYQEANLDLTLYHTTKSRAKRQGLEHTITREDIKISTHCPVLGIPLDKSRGKGKQDGSVSVDRIDNTKGYIPGNIQVISLLANRMKNNATPEQLKAFAEWVLKNV